MQPKSTQSILRLFCRRFIAIALIFFSAINSSYAQTDLFNETFTTVVPPGWAQNNLSTPIGADPTWSQGIDFAGGLWDAHSGASDSWARAQYQNVGGANTISNWLFCPQVLLTNGDIFSFWTRTVDVPGFADRLQVRLSTNGASVDVGTTNLSVGDYSTLLLDINPTYTLTDYPTVWTLQTITISGLAAPIQGRIAFRYFVEDGGPQGNNSDNIGVDDVIYFQSVTPPCSGTPALGNTLATSASVCPGTPVSLSAQNVINGSGVTYQWQSSPTLAGPYTDIAGATSNAYSTTITVDTYFQLVAICSGTPGNSTPVLVALTPPSGCYCVPVADCSFDDYIANVDFAGISNASNCAPTAYTDYTTTVAAGNPVSGAPNPISVAVGPGGNEYVTAWIDYDHSGTFDANEYALIGNGNGSTINGTINIPATAQSGLTRMRLRVRYNVANPNTAACIDNVFGEVEDYAVNITPCIPGVFSAQPAAITAACGQNATFSATAAGSFLTYQWQTRASATALWTNVIDGTGISGATTNTLQLTAVVESMSGSEYRVLISGGCTATDFSDIAALTVTPLVIDVSPAEYATCSPIPATAPVALTITTQNGISTSTTVSIPSGAINIAIPDGDLAGVIHAIPVSLPAGAVITAASVKVNIPHTWAGDLIIALKAPNGNVLNLDYALTHTGGAGATAGFTNTVISSTGTATLLSGTDPWTGTFAADADPNPVAGIPTAATNLSPSNANVFTWAGLYSVPNGDWTIGVYDYTPPDDGTLNDWELTLTYTTSQTIPYTGIWSPSAGLFTDATGTTPYAGTQETTVYAAPSATTVYTVTVTDANCPPAPVLVPVSILSPDPVVTITASPDQPLYPGLYTTLTGNVDPAASPAATYQWFYGTTAIQGATSTSIQVGADALGDYVFAVSDPGTCSGVAGATFKVRDSVTNTLFIMPNPNNGIFIVRYDDGVNDLLQKPRVLTIYDSKGARVYQQNYTVNVPYGAMHVDISRFGRGVYIVDLTDTQGKRLQSGKVVVR